MNSLITIFRIPELSRKILFTVICIAIYRIGYYVPLPVVDQQLMAERMGGGAGSLGQVLGLVSMFSGGNFSQSCIFALGIMPYISASIIFQLLGSVYPPLEKLQKEGPAGQKKINEYTRYATVPICLIQAFGYVNYSKPFLHAGYSEGFNFYYFAFASIIIMTAGTVFLMWLGEQIDEYGIGNGISLIIMSGIVARIPEATRILFYDSATGKFKPQVFQLGGGGTGDVGFEKLLVLMFLFVAVVVWVVLITKGQRRIPTQSAKHVRGRRVYGGTKQYLPLKVNQAGVMPVIFASSLLMLPTFVLPIVLNWANWPWLHSLSASFQRQGYIYNVFFIVLIYFFCYFWTAIQFNPKDMSNNLKDYGSFIPGYRPGKRTADYLEKVLLRVTYIGAAFLAVIAVIPSLISGTMDIDPRVASFYGGTGLLIVISVALDLVKKINSHLVMRNYPGLTED
ncbi:MAG: preprotein translocase subunit SecY [Gemmataceae bacterium]|nr:preprotein translocase subunit SecY [Gemmataceae bacterium]